MGGGDRDALAALLHGHIADAGAAADAEAGPDLGGIHSVDLDGGMGGRGAFIASADGLRKMVPALKVPVVDSTAAGDAFNGGTASALMRGMALEQAVKFGVAVAAASVMRPGAQTAMPNAPEVAELLGQHGTNMDLEDTLAQKRIRVSC